MLTLSALRMAVDKTSARLPGLGIVWDGVPSFFPTRAAPCLRLCHSPAVRRVCKQFYGSLEQSDAVNTYTCPFGTILCYLPLNAYTNNIAGLVVHLRITANQVNEPGAKAALAKIHRIDKPMIKRLLADSTNWDNPCSPSIEQELGEARRQVQKVLDEQKDEALKDILLDYEDFVGSFSHEALSPIQEIRTKLEEAESLLDSDSEACGLVIAARQAMDKVRTSLNGMTLLFNHEHERPDKNRFLTVDAFEKIAHWAQIYDAQVRNRNLQLIYSPSHGPWRVFVVPEYFEIMVRNLLNNAIKYSFDASTYDTPGKILEHLKFEMSFFR